VLAQQPDEGAHPRRVVGPRACRHHQTVDHYLGVDELRAGRRHVGGKRGVGGGAAAMQDAERRQRERRVAELGHGTRILEEVPDDPLEVRIVAEVLGCPAAGDDEGRVPGRVDLGEGEVGRPRLARLLRVGVEALDEVVYHELEPLPRWRRDLDFVPFLAQALIRIEDLERLRSVAGENEDACHACQLLERHPRAG